MSVTPEWIHFTQKIRDWLQVSASVLQSKDYSGNAIVQASVALTIAAGYFDQPFSFKMPQKITKLKMIIFSIHLLSKWTSDEGRDPPFCPGCSMFTDSYCPARWLSRLLSQGCLLPASAEEDAEEEGLNTESAEEQSGVSPSCQQGNNVLGSSVATHITPTLSPQAISQVRVTLSWLSELVWATTAWKMSSHHHLSQLHQQLI